MARVFVGMSGGVDSSVAAALLKKAGHDVVGVFIRVLGLPAGRQDPPEHFSEVCTWREDRRDAMRVAARLGIPLVTLDLSKAYEREVIRYMLREYRVGRTPNPDVECNREIKFGLFYRWARKRGADFVATGHYVKLQPPAADGFRLLVAKDKEKDQSYFLWTLNQNQLKHCLFPIGEYRKSEVRRLAKKFGLPNAEKKDSQGLCFIGKLNIKDFLKQYIKPRPGKVENERGEEIGEHEGVWFYTLGERRGFRILKKNPRSTPYYVVGKNVRKNLLIVSEEPDRYFKGQWVVNLSGVNWLAGTPPDLGKKYQARVRYRGRLLDCRLVKKGRRFQVEFSKSPMPAAPGQSLVLYRKNKLIGGGVIES